MKDVKRNPDFVWKCINYWNQKFPNIDWRVRNEMKLSSFRFAENFKKSEIKAELEKFVNELNQKMENKEESQDVFNLLAVIFKANNKKLI